MTLDHEQRARHSLADRRSGGAVGLRPGVPAGQPPGPARGSPSTPAVAGLTQAGPRSGGRGVPGEARGTAGPRTPPDCGRRQRSGARPAPRTRRAGRRSTERAHGLGPAPPGSAPGCDAVQPPHRAMRVAAGSTVLPSERTSPGAAQDRPGRVARVSPSHSPRRRRRPGAPRPAQGRHATAQGLSQWPSLPTAASCTPATRWAVRPRSPGQEPLRRRRAPPGEPSRCTPQPSEPGIGSGASPGRLAGCGRDEMW